LRNKHGEIYILDAKFLDSLVNEVLDLLPNVERQGSENIAA
jgi:hypothetical protein